MESGDINSNMSFLGSGKLELSNSIMDHGYHIRSLESMAPHRTLFIANKENKVPK